MRAVHKYMFSYPGQDCAEQVKQIFVNQLSFSS